MDKPTPPTYSGPLDSERPADVTHWCATWHAFRATKTPALCEYDVLAWIETLECTVAAQRTLLAEMREAMDNARHNLQGVRDGRYISYQNSGDFEQQLDDALCCVQDEVDALEAALKKLAVSADGDA